MQGTYRDHDECAIVDCPRTAYAARQKSFVLAAALSEPSSFGRLVRSFLNLASYTSGIGKEVDSTLMAAARTYGCLFAFHRADPWQFHNWLALMYKLYREHRGVTVRPD